MKRITTLFFATLLLATAAKAQQLTSQEQQIIGNWAVAYDQVDESRGLVFNIEGVYTFNQDRTLVVQSATEMLFSINKDGVDNTIVINMGVEAHKLWKIEDGNLVLTADPDQDTKVVINDIRAMNNDPISQLMVSSMYASTDVLINKVKTTTDEPKSNKINAITADELSIVNPDGSILTCKRIPAE